MNPILIVLIVISAISLLIYFKRGRNAVWGGATLGLVVGLVISFITRHWIALAWGITIGTLSGLISELSGLFSRRKIVGKEFQQTSDNAEDLKPDIADKVAVTVSKLGLVKCSPIRVYIPLDGWGREWNGQGIIHPSTRDVDAPRILIVTETHNDLLFFTNTGKVFHLKCHELPYDESQKTKGIPVINLVPIEQNERVASIVPLTDCNEGTCIIIATRYGKVKKTAVNEIISIPSSEINVINLDKGDELVAASLLTEKDDIIEVTRNGQSIRFNASELSTSSINKGCVPSIRLKPNDEVVSLDIVQDDAFLLVVSSGGFGKMTPIVDYPRQHRTGNGVSTIKLSEFTGKVSAARVVKKSPLIMIVSENGICQWEKQIAIQGRNTQGLKVVRTDIGDNIIALFSIYPI